MFKQIVFSAVAVFMVAQANAEVGRDSLKEGGKAKDEVLKEQHAETLKAGGKFDREAIIKKNVDELLGSSLSATDRQVILDLAKQDKNVARSLVDLLKSKKNALKTKSDENALIDDAQMGALQTIAKITDLTKRVAASNLDKGDDKLSKSERYAFNLLLKVPSQARSWAKNDKAIAAETIKILGEEAKNKTIDQAVTETTRRMANHPDEKLRANIDIDKVAKDCGA